MNATTTRCAVSARALGLDPIGTAGSYEGFLLLEWPRPWPRELGEVGELSPVLSTARGLGLRVQAVAGASLGAQSSVVLYAKPKDEMGFRRYERREAAVPRAEVVRAALELMTDAMSSDQPVSDTVADLLICTHGRRDRCCGSLGTALHSQMAAVGNLGTTRIWRSSHLGGHRFAPTLLHLPTGTSWAFMNADLASRVVATGGLDPQLSPHYRGCTGLASPEVQALERVVADHVGWQALGHRRSSARDVRGRFLLTVEDSAGSSRRWSAEVVRFDVAAPPPCGSAEARSIASEPRWSVRDLREIS